MKITAIKAGPLKAPLDTTYWIATNAFDSAGLILVQVQTDQGITGLATVAGFGMKGVCAMLHALNDVVVGMDPMETEAVWQKVFSISTASANPADRWFNRDAFPRDQRALFVRALAGLDIACWDIKAKALGLPVYRLLGGAKRNVPAYITGGYYQANRGLLGFDGELAQYVADGMAR